MPIVMIDFQKSSGSNMVRSDLLICSVGQIQTVYLTHPEMTWSHVQRVRILYKTILKLHRGLPQELQVVGTNYAREEFKRHKSCKLNEAEIFINEWTKYAILLAEQLGLRGPHTGTRRVGAPLPQSDIEQLRDEQIHQLYELMEEATKANQNK